MKLVKLTPMEAELAKIGYKLQGASEPQTKRKPMSDKTKKALSKATKARWAAKKASKPS